MILERKMLKLLDILVLTISPTKEGAEGEEAAVDVEEEAAEEEAKEEEEAVVITMIIKTSSKTITNQKEDINKEEVTEVGILEEKKEATRGVKEEVIKIMSIESLNLRIRRVIESASALTTFNIIYI